MKRVTKDMKYKKPLKQLVVIAISKTRIKETSEG